MKSLLAALLLLAVCVSSSSSFDLDSLLVKSVGGQTAVESIKSVRNVRATGRIATSGLEGTFESIYMAPDKLFLSLNFQGFGMVQAYDGSTAWQKDHNGYVSHMDGSQKEDFLRQVYFESYSFLFEDTSLRTVEYRGTASLDGATYHELAFFPLESDTVIAYYRLSDGLKHMTVSKADNIDTYTITDDYRLVQGVQTSFHSYAWADGVPTTADFTADSITVNSDIDPAIFDFPSSQTSDFRFPDNTDTVKIPIAFHRGHIHLKATVNGKASAWFILDSGASANIFHIGLAEELNLPVIGTIPAHGISGFEEINLVRTDSISIGNLKLYDQVAGADEFSMLGMNSPLGGDQGGILGHDFLSRFPIMVNYQDSVLVVYNPETFVPPTGGAEVDFYVTRNVPTISAELNGIKGDYIVDLGNPFGVVIHYPFAQEHDLDEQLGEIEDLPRALRGVGGSLGGRIAAAETFVMGDLKLSDIRVILSESSGGISGSEQLAGNIGNLVLSNFRVLFDYAGRRIIFYR